MMLLAVKGGRSLEPGQADQGSAEDTARSGPERMGMWMTDGFVKVYGIRLE